MPQIARSGSFKEPNARIVLIDRDPSGSRALADALVAELSAPAVLFELHGGREAIELLRSQDCDLLLVECDSLNDLGEAAEAMARLVKVAAGALVVALSATTSVSATMAALASGAHDCLARDVGAEAFVSRVGELAQRHGKLSSLRFELPRADRIYAEIDRVAGSMATASRIVGGERPSSLPELNLLLQRLAHLIEGGGIGVDSIASALDQLEAGPAPRPPVLPLWRQEQRIIEDAIASFGGNVALAAAALELSPSTIYRKRQAWAEMDGRRGAA